MKVRITHLDGNMPNLALMTLASWHRAQGHQVFETKDVNRGIDEPVYDAVYASTIFTFSNSKTEAFKSHFPAAIVGGSGSGSAVSVEDVIGGPWPGLDYTAYPEFKESIGFTQRGCRLRCEFCIVPKKEGPPKKSKSISDIWRGAPHPKKILLLDNDFFGQSTEEWMSRITEIQDGSFKVCFNQGVNLRNITSLQAQALASVQYRSKDFARRRIYTAWDRAKDEASFFRGVSRLEDAGIPTKHIMAYMLVGYDPDEPWDAIMVRFNKLVCRGILPYPMVYDKTRKDLKAFQRWAVTGLYRFVPWDEYVWAGSSRGNHDVESETEGDQKCQHAPLKPSVKRTTQLSGTTQTPRKSINAGLDVATSSNARIVNMCGDAD